MKNVPSFSTALVTNIYGDAREVRDYGATVDNLQRSNEGFTRDQRLRVTYGDDYQSLRIGKSQMTVPEFEKRVLDLQQATTDKAYVDGVEAMAKGRLPYKEGEYARVLGSFIDKQVRAELRGFAMAQGINDRAASNIWAVNRSIGSTLVEGKGIPDNRLGSNLFADTTLAWKNGYTEQITKWNAIRPDANYLMVRPTQIGGSYLIPRASIQPYAPVRPTGRSL